MVLDLETKCSLRLVSLTLTETDGCWGASIKNSVNVFSYFLRITLHVFVSIIECFPIDSVTFKQVTGDQIYMNHNIVLRLSTSSQTGVVLRYPADNQWEMCENKTLLGYRLCSAGFLLSICGSHPPSNRNMGITKWRWDSGEEVSRGTILTIQVKHTDWFRVQTYYIQQTNGKLKYVWYLKIWSNNFLTESETLKDLK